MHKENVVYLFGAGSTQAELKLKSISSDTTMVGINRAVLSSINKYRGPYYKIFSRTGTQPTNLDIELMISLFEANLEKDSKKFKPIISELRKDFRKYLISQITAKKVKPDLTNLLLHLHKDYSRYMGQNGENLLSILTINYDNLIEKSLEGIYGGLNVGVPFKSVDYKYDNTITPMIKLHGSFNWMLKGGKLSISDAYNDTNGWIPPSVYKTPKQEQIFWNLWNQANRLLKRCDVLRIVGASLRAEDIYLISLIFLSQAAVENPFKIELINTDNSIKGTVQKPGIITRFPFLANVKGLKALPVYKLKSDKLRAGYRIENPYKFWIEMKLSEVEGNYGKALEDEFVNNIHGVNTSEI